MSGWIMVKDAGWTGKAALEKWIDTGNRFALSLPEKKKRAAAKKRMTGKKT